MDLTSSTKPGQQIHKFDHTRTANPCDWLPCRRAALPLVGCPHSLVYLHLPVVEGLIFCISANTPIWEPPSHYSMLRPQCPTFGLWRPSMGPWRPVWSRCCRRYTAGGDLRPRHAAPLPLPLGQDKGRPVSVVSRGSKTSGV